MAPMAAMSPMATVTEQVHGHEGHAEKYPDPVLCQPIHVLLLELKLAQVSREGCEPSARRKARTPPPRRAHHQHEQRRQQWNGKPRGQKEQLQWPQVGGLALVGFLAREYSRLQVRLERSNLHLLDHAVAPTAAGATAAVALGLALLMPASFVRLSSRALIATTAELPDIDSAAISGDSVKG